MKLVVPTLSILLAGLVGFSVASCGSGGAEAVGSVPSLPGNAAATVDRTTSTVMSEPESDSTTSEAAAKRVVVELWFTEGETLFLRKVSAESPGPRVGSQAVTMLLAGPGEDEEELATAIPAETKLLGLSIDGGVATVDLTSEFESGGGSLSMRMRIAQIVYTLTQFPTVDSVLFELDGEPVEAIGGEGVIVDQPLRRKNYADLLPAIVVATPFVEQAVGSPIRVSGTANVFEANVTVRILDAHGREIARTFTTATCGTGCRGTFSVDVPYSVNEDQSGWVVVSDDDAAGVGRPPHEVKIPVELGV